ncbi:hypothetical protein Ddye_023326 [Dipteronia dyeriana]|uniref:Uncharacterized protein n=1 Tax=Dipteronia dyeriana TaxID=168575 RepID=A0AAD9TTC5_9ROSI|nr:hypothetical protein Ddye_023326 [Dipteronia dyeriana]
MKWSQSATNAVVECGNGELLRGLSLNSNFFNGDSVVRDVNGEDDRVAGQDPVLVVAGPEGPSNINVMKIASGSGKGNIQKGKRGLGCDSDTNEMIIKVAEFSMVELPIAFNSSKIRKVRASCLAVRSHGMKTRNSKFNWPRILGEQIITVIDLGFDFYDKDVRMADVFTEAM